MRVDPTSPSFSGRVSIEVKLAQPLDTIWLHQKRLDIKSAQIRSDDLLQELRQIESADPELLGLRAAHPIGAGKATLEIEYAGSFGNRVGLFRQDSRGDWYAYTDFEAIDARSAFPCFDDPRFKVPWDLTLTVPISQRAFANAPQIEEVIEGNEKTVRFETTRPLPSYLVAFAVGPFEVLQSGPSRIPMRVITPQGLSAKGRFALDNLPTWIAFLEGYFGMQMPYKKVDLIAVPRFGGAMENPGLITFSAGLLLVDPAQSGSLAIRRSAGVIAHELAHLWFGDLVTMHYWNDLWLNEGFATWMSDKVVAAWRPDQAREVLDIADKMSAYHADASPGSRVVRQPIKRREDIAAAFDAITYRKGGAILEMFEAWLGEETVRNAVRDYVRNHVDGNAKSEDFVSALSKAAGQDIATAMASFLDQTGIPLVEAKLDCSGSPTAILRQSAHQPLGSSPSQNLWKIPICLRYGGSKTAHTQCALLESRELQLPLETKTCPTWLHPNKGEHGYYHYSAPYAQLLERTQLDPREISGLAHNAEAALRAGRMSVSDFLILVKALASRRSRHADQALLTALQLIERSVVANEDRAAFGAFVREAYGSRIREIGVTGIKGEPDRIKLTRPALLELVADLGNDRRLRKQVRKEVDRWLDTQESMNTLLLGSWLRIAAIDGDRSLFERYEEIASSTKDAERRFLLRTAQLAFRKESLLLRALDRLRQSGLSPLAIERLAIAVADPVLGPRVLEFLGEHREAILAAASNNVRPYLPVAFSQLCSTEGLALLRDFVDASTPALGWSMQSIRSCISFADFHREDAAKALRK
jgi:alanyl aminopeptidase